ncbi:MAG TPA: hypothetical protein DEQ61_05330, partial [Streptomyces sp.]|nr:hypothetical protein [Streptomyces sp.]
MDNVPPPYAALESELRQLDLTLARVDAERHALLTRRAGLITLLSRAAQPAAGARPATGGGSSGRGSTDPAADLGATGRDASPTTVRNVLLALGGVLLAAAVIAFTVVSWGRLGIGGRAVVLGLLTVTALAASVPLLRRALTATAEVVACLGLLLLVLDAYALHRVALPGTDATAYAAGASAVLAAVWTAYSRWLGGRVPATGPDRR